MIKKSGEELYSKTYQSPTVTQRSVRKPNLHYERQDTASSDARTPVDHSSKHKDCDGGTSNESCGGEMDFRIQGLLHSAVQEHDHIRKKAVQKLTHQFETHPQADLKQNRVFNPYYQRAVEGNDLQHGKHRTLRDWRDYFKIQCPNCMTSWTKGIVYCTCGTCLRLSDKVRKLNSDRYDVLSIPNYVIKNGASHGARRGNTERQIIHHAAHLSSKNAKKKGIRIHTG